MKHSFVFSPKRFMAVAVLFCATTFSAVAQDPTFAYAGKSDKTKGNAPLETNDMIKRGYRLNVQLENADDLRFLVQIENPASEKLILSVKDANNNTLHREVLNADSPKFIARFNLDKLDDGEYFFEIRNGRNKIEKSIDIRTQTRIDRVVSVQ